jgi:hypothetical protein
MINIRVMGSFTPSYNSINVPGLPYLVYNRYPVDRQGRQAVKRFMPAAFKTKKLGHIQPLVIYDPILIWFLMVSGSTFFADSP